MGVILTTYVRPGSPSPKYPSRNGADVSWSGLEADDLVDRLFVSSRRQNGDCQNEEDVHDILIYNIQNVLMLIIRKNIIVNYHIYIYLYTVQYMFYVNNKKRQHS